MYVRPDEPDPEITIVPIDIDMIEAKNWFIKKLNNDNVILAADNFLLNLNLSENKIVKISKSSKKIQGIRILKDLTPILPRSPTNFLITLYFKDFTYEILEITNFQANPNQKIFSLLLPNFEFKKYSLLSTKSITNLFNVFLLEG